MCCLRKLVPDNSDMCFLLRNLFFTGAALFQNMPCLRENACLGERCLYGVPPLAGFTVYRRCFPAVFLPAVECRCALPLETA